MRALPVFLGLLALTALGLTAWSACGIDAPQPAVAARSPHVPEPPPTAVPAAAERDVAPSPTAAANVFASFDEDDRPIAAPVRDGLCVWVCSRRGEPAADLPLAVYWRKGFGLYGRDVGHTDERGRFATTIGAVEQFEGIEVQHPRLGELSYHDALLPTAEDARTVCLVVPDLAPLRVRVVDLHGGPVGGCTVEASGGGASALPRRFLLQGGPRRAPVDAAGAITLQVPHGAYELRAECEHAQLPQLVYATVGPDGGDAAIVMLPDSQRVEVEVRVVAPAGHRAVIKVAASTSEVPDRNGLPGRGGDALLRPLFVDRQGEHTFVVRAEGLPWTCVVTSDGCEAQKVAVPAGQLALAVTLAPAVAQEPPPKARLRVQVLDPAGQPTFADVRVHETPDLVYGSDRGTDGHGHLLLELEPKGRVCVSASRYGYARAMAGPFELTDGEQAVVLQLLPQASISGRVVDAAGNGVECRVCLRRPAGALAQMADGVPAILPDGPTSDHRGTLPDGSFTFADCGPGEHELQAFPLDGRLPGRVRAQPGATATIVLGEGLTDLSVVRGTVRDAVSGAPVAGAELWSPLAFAWSIRSGADGRFQFAARPGELQLSVRCRGFAAQETAPRTIDLAPVVLDIALPPAPVRFLRAVDAGGAPLPGARIAVLGADGEPIELFDQQGSADDVEPAADAAGRVDVRGAPVGPLRVRVRRGELEQVFEVPASGGFDTPFDLPWRD